jgi:4-hydroxy-2-oxoglutarate aldolase
MHLFIVVILFGVQVTRELGVPAMKEAMDMMGLYGGPCRRPLQPLTDSERQTVRDAFKKNGFHPKY